MAAEEAPASEKDLDPAPSEEKGNSENQKIQDLPEVHSVSMPESEDGGGGEEEEQERESRGYTLGDHATYLSLGNFMSETDYPYCDVSKFFVDCHLSKLALDYCCPVPLKYLHACYFGLVDDPKNKTTTDAVVEHLPVRTTTFRLRPDIMAAVVVDAVQDACEASYEVSSHILRREDGYLQCLLLPKEGNHNPAFILEATICTAKSKLLERQLLLRVFYADSYNKNNGDRPSKPQNKRQQQQQRTSLYESNDDDEKKSPVNERLKDACGFLQHVEQTIEDDESNKDPLKIELSSPADIEPSVSVRYIQMLKKPPPITTIFPSLNPEDWTLLQFSWGFISHIWQNLLGYNCLFHKILDIPLCDAGDDHGPVLDLHYCTQIRTIARHQMLEEIESSMSELQNNLNETERSYRNFLNLIKRSRDRFGLKKINIDSVKGRQLELPTAVLPPGFPILAATVCKQATENPDDPTAICDDAVRKVYRAFCSDDDQYARNHLNKANRALVDRVVEIQQSQISLIRELESFPKAQNAAKEFCVHARQANNVKGRVEKVVFARVPLVDLPIIGGRCQVTSNAMLCTAEGLFGRAKHSLFDLKAVNFFMQTQNRLNIVTAKSQEVIYKIDTATNIPNFIEFLSTLKTLESVGVVKINREVNDNTTGKDQNQSAVASPQPQQDEKASSTNETATPPEAEERDTGDGASPPKSDAVASGASAPE